MRRSLAFLWQCRHGLSVHHINVCNDHPAMEQPVVTVHINRVNLCCSPQTIQFFTKFDSPDIGKLAATNLDNWVECMEKCMCVDVDQRKTSDIIVSMQAMEDRLRSAMDLHSQAANSNIEKTGHKVIAEIHSGVDTVTEQAERNFTSMITSVENVVRASVEKLNVEAMATKVSASVRDWLQVEVNCLKTGQVLAASAVEKLEGKLCSIVTHMFSEPQAVRHQHLIGMLNGLPAQVSQMCAQASADNALTDKVAQMRVRLEEVMAIHSRELLENKASVNTVVNSVRQVIASIAESKSSAATHITQVPVYLKSVLQEKFKEQEAQSQEVRRLVFSTQQQLSRMETETSRLMEKVSADVTNRLDQLMITQVKQENSNSAKGKKGESKLYDILSAKFTARDGYTIDVVSGIAHACDMNIRRVGFPDVRVEVKAHGELTGVKVGSKETERFRSDLITMQSSGIFVSLYSDIVGKGKFEVDVLPTNKLAVFLSSNNFEVDPIFDMMQVIYRVDKIIDSFHTDGSSCVKITEEGMALVQSHLKDFAVKSQTIKSHLKASISLLDEMLFDKIDIILSGRAVGPVAVARLPVQRPVVIAAFTSPVLQNIVTSQQCLNHGMLKQTVPVVVCSVVCHPKPPKVYPKGPFPLPPAFRPLNYIPPNTFTASDKVAPACASPAPVCV